MEFTSAQNVSFSLFDLLDVPVYANACMYECMRHNMQCLMQSEYVVASRGWENERMSMSEHIQQLEQDVGFLRMRQDDAAPDSDGEDG